MYPIYSDIHDTVQAAKTQFATLSTSVCQVDTNNMASFKSLSVISMIEKATWTKTYGLDILRAILTYMHQDNIHQHISHMDIRSSTYINNNRGALGQDKQQTVKSRDRVHTPAIGEQTDEYKLKTWEIKCVLLIEKMGVYEWIYPVTAYNIFKASGQRLPCILAHRWRGGGLEMFS